jgi:hypothetical protein
MNLPTLPTRRFIVHWHYVKDERTLTIRAQDVREARSIFRASTRHLGYGVTILKITVHPEDRKSKGRLPKATDHCRTCGSDNLFSGFFGADDLAVSDDREPGSRYTTFCNECGDEWK